MSYKRPNQLVKELQVANLVTSIFFMLTSLKLCSMWKLRNFIPYQNFTEKFYNDKE